MSSESDEPATGSTPESRGATSPDESAAPARDSATTGESTGAAGDSAGDSAGDAAAPSPFDGPDWQARPRQRSSGRARRRRTSQRRLRRRRRYGIAMIVVGAAILVIGAWVLITALLARTQLEDVRAEVRQLHAQVSAGNLDAARATARQLSQHAAKADDYTSGPAWALVANIPAGGAPFQTVRTITAQVDVLGQQVLPEVITATRQLDPSTLRRSDGTIDLARISAVAPTLVRADSAMNRATAAVAARPSTTWLGPVDRARTDLLTQMRSLGKTLHSATLASQIAPPMLGMNGTKRYFVSFQNDAEARGTGGLPGAFGIVRADHGKISVERFENDGALSGVRSGLDFGADYDRLWSVSNPYNEYVDSNVSAHFPYAARIWLAMWQHKTHEKLDGALAVDPQALAYLLAVTGPATMPDHTSVSASNIVQLTQQTLYSRYPTNADVAARKSYLLAVARAVSSRVIGARGNTTALVKAAGRAAAERRLLVYSTDPRTEASLQGTSLSGAIGATASPFAAVVVNNDAGNKLDYYLERSITWTRTGCGRTRDVTVTITLTNTAPPGLSAYVDNRSDKPNYPVKPGDNRLGVFYYATTGAFRVSTQLDGKIAQVAQGTELGHPVYGVDVEMPRGATRTLVFHMQEPAGSGAPVVLRQPLVKPVHVTVQDQSCG